MGNCRSCQYSKSMENAKLILFDGELLEFSCPVKVLHFLQQNPGCFICDSDDMEFDELVSAVNADDELQPGQLYFQLPLTWSKRRLQPEDMAALAVKASVALATSGGEKCATCCCMKRVEPLIFLNEKEAKPRSPAAVGGGGVVEKRKGSGDHLYGRKFAANLSVIAEEQMV